MAKDFRGAASAPRGIRNNNPGNLVYNPSIKWQGQVGNDGHFTVFSNILYGIRAYAMDTKHDINKGANTIEKLIYQSAPPTENQTEKYINTVSKVTGISRTQKLTPKADTLVKLAQGAFTVENGAGYTTYITVKDIVDGVRMLPGLTSQDIAALSMFVIIIFLFIALSTI